MYESLIYFSAKPVIPVQRQERETPIGAEVVLTCLAGGDPPPVITWSKKDGALPGYVN